MCKVIATLTSKDENKNLTLQPGQGLSIELEEMAGAGYVWQSRMEPDGILKLESSSRVTADNAAMGAAATRRFTFCAVSPGSVTILLEMRRPWETAGTAAKSMQIHVSVSD